MSYHSCCGFLLIVLILFSKINFGSSLYCYVCTQPKGQNLPCEVNVETMQQTQCTEGHYCIKYIWTTLGSSVIGRHCAPPNRCEVLRANSTEFDFLEFCELCYSNLCNAGAVHKISFTLIGIMLCFKFIILV